MKRVRADEQAKEGLAYRGAAGLPNASSGIVAYQNAATVKVVSEGMQSGIYSSAPPVNYGAMPAAATAPHAGKPQAAMQSLGSAGGGGHPQVRVKGASPPSAPLPTSAAPAPAPVVQQQQQHSPGGSNFQKLKVEDALSYLDLVKLKFGKEPQVYNDFLDIMKEFKSQSIDTPGVIHRVSSLFHGYPELIVGFNTFLPPGYKIEVQRNDSGYAFHVSVSASSPTGALLAQQKPSMILSGSGTIIHSNVSSMNIPLAPQPPQAPPPQAPPPPPPQQPQPQPQPMSTILHTVVPTPPPANAGYNNSYSNSGLHANSASAQNTLQLSAAQAAVTQALQGGHGEAPQNQPVEFNHAINYVNKIKNRFQGQPEKYKRFLEILHTYQKEQRTLKEVQGQGAGGKHLTEQEVYSQVAKLFENQGDLLAEFGQFLPDATSHISAAPALSDHPNVSLSVSGGGGGNINAKKQLPATKPYHRDMGPERHHLSHKPSHNLAMPIKRSPPYSNPARDAPPPKKHKTSSLRDVTFSEASKHSTLLEFAFFDKVRKAVRSQDVYNNFLRCLSLFNQEIISKTELVQLVTPFLGKFPELMRWFREFLGQNEVEAIPYVAARIERPQGDLAHDVDYSTAKRLGASYCVIPPAQEGLKFSGRTELCNQVLNNQWVSFPMWSEDSSFVGPRKNQYEEYMFRCEDERFELDVVIETNASTIRVLEGVSKKMNRMSPEELCKFRLDDCLGGSSPVLHQRALKRIYGDKAQDIIDGLKRNPAVAVPVILRRLKSKEEEWREAQKGFNKIWREQNEKNYLKSLDHLGINFKQNDTKALRSKSMLADIEQALEERNEQLDRGLEVPMGPHWMTVYQDRNILDDAANLLIHHVKRHTSVQKGEKRRIKHLLRQFLPDLFFHPRQQLSDDEREEDEDKEEGNESPTSNSSKEETKKKGNVSPGKSPRTSDQNDSDDKHSLDNVEIKVEDADAPAHAQSNYPDEEYTLFMGTNNWYLFLRLHSVLCERLAKIYDCAAKMAADESRVAKTRKDSTAIALRLKPKPQIRIEDYFPTFLDLVKNLLDGNTDPNTYEDTLREMFGIHAYIAFTLDKVIQYAMRQLQHCVTEKLAIKAMERFAREQKRGATGGPCATAHRRLHKELQYQRAMEHIVDEENCYKIYIYKLDGRMTVELLDAEDTGDGKKVDDAKKWSTYKESYADCTNVEQKPLSPLFLRRNMRKYNKKNKRRNSTTSNSDKASADAEEKCDVKAGATTAAPSAAAVQRLAGSGGEDDEQPERKPNIGGGAPERDQTEHADYDVSDETQCRFSTADSKIVFVANKDSFLYKRSALTRAKQTHPAVTKFKSTRFRAWCKRWAAVNVSDAQSKQCNEWLMGRGDNVVRNRTRVLTNNDLTLTPYIVYNRYRVELFADDST